MAILIIIVISGTLVLGALWGLYGKLSEHVEGFLIALAGGALLVSAVLELVHPALKSYSIIGSLSFVLLGATVFTVIDFFVNKHWKSSGGLGLLVAITLDGVPENLALGVALIGAEPISVAALAGSILLSNLPEATGGAKDMVQDKHPKVKILLLWSATALLLSFAALFGYYFLSNVPEKYLAYIKCFAGGAVVASLALEVFPKSFKKDKYWTGIATALGLILALWLNTLGH